MKRLRVVRFPTAYIDIEHGARKFFLDISVEGWMSIMVSLWFLLAIIGTYLCKVFDETKKCPLYVISNRINI